ncbi:MAG: hypothetical protein AAGN35_07065 [Bacteroidota bacterium]
MRVFESRPRRSLTEDSSPTQGLAYDAVVSGPQMESESEQSPQPSGGEVTQMIRAYRVGTSKSKYKVQVDPKTGKITEFRGGKSGIDISFGDRAHAEYYLQTKQGDPEAELVEWEMDDTLYEMIVARMKNVGGSKIPREWKSSGSGKKSQLQAMWDVVSRASSPTNSSDQYVRKNNLIAPHFGLDWIAIFNKYGKGSARVSGHSESASPAPPAPSGDYEDDELVVLIDTTADSDPLILDYASAQDTLTDPDWSHWRLVSRATAIRDHGMREEDFAEYD